MAKIDYDVGDLVVCVDDSPCDVTGRQLGIKFGSVYVVTKIEMTPFGQVGVLVGGCRGFGYRNMFNARRFRKLPKKSQEFFAGEKQVVKDLVPAE